MNHLSPPTFQGYFWLPEHPDAKVPGRFYCADDGSLQLDVLGTFPGRPLQPDPIPRIVGESERGEPVTFEGCFYRTQKLNLPGLALSSIHVNLALIGCHVDGTEPVCFDEIFCHSDAITEWLEFAPIAAILATSPTGQSATLSFSQPAALEWSLPNGVTMTMRSSWTAPGGRKHREASISQKTWVGFTYPSATPLDDLLKRTQRFSNFVSFVVDQTLPLNAIEVYSNDLVEDVGDRKRKVPVRVFFAPDSAGAPNLSWVSPPFPLFSFQYVRDRFGDIVGRWLDNYDAFDSSFNLYFATKTGRDLYLSNRFLMLAQALESLHRRSSADTAFGTAEYAALRETLEKAIPEMFREWLDARLKYGNEPSLRNRLKALFGVFDGVYGGDKKVRGLVSRIVDTRNYLTHYDHSLRDRASNGRDLYKLCLALETLFQLHMATLCGLPTDEVTALCKRSALFGRKTAEFA